MKLSEYARKNNIHYQTAWLHWKKGLLNAKQLPTGTIVIEEDIQSNPTQNVCVIYSRVSSSQNRDNLDAQADRLYQYAVAKGYKVYKIIKEVGSGLNDNRPKLINILQDDNYSILLVEHKDRLTRFGFNYIQIMLESKNKYIEVINMSENNKADLLEDFINIITSFCARIYGQRRSKRKTEQIIKELEDDKVS